jgi:hypothetical protein
MSLLVFLQENEVIYAVTGKAGQNTYYKKPMVNQISFTILDNSRGAFRVTGTVIIDQ